MTSSGVGGNLVPSVIPALLPFAHQARFGTWFAVESGDIGGGRGGGGRIKRPFGRGGVSASSADPAGWMTLPEAQAEFERIRQSAVAAGKVPEGVALPPSLGGLAVFLGVVDGVGLAGVDLDTCVDGSGLAPWAVEVLAAVGHAGAEISPSATGVKVLLPYRVEDLDLLRSAFALSGDAAGRSLWKASAVDGAGGAGGHAPGIEVYLGLRFFALTGQELVPGAGGGIGGAAGIGIWADPGLWLGNMRAGALAAVAAGLRGGEPLAEARGDAVDTTDMEPLGPVESARRVLEACALWPALAAVLGGDVGPVNEHRADRSDRSSAAFILGGMLKAYAGLTARDCIPFIRDSLIPEIGDWYAEKGPAVRDREILRGWRDHPPVPVGAGGSVPSVSELALSGASRRGMPPLTVGAGAPGTGGGDGRGQSAANLADYRGLEGGDGGADLGVSGATEIPPAAPLAVTPPLPGAVLAAAAGIDVAPPTAAAKKSKMFVPADDNGEWLTRLTGDDYGYYGTVGNLLILLQRDPVLTGLFQHDEFRQEYQVTRPLPPGDCEPPQPGPYPRQWTEEDITLLHAYVQRRWGHRFGRRTIEEGAASAAKNARRHPIREWLADREAAWDGVARLDRWLIDICGAADDPYNRAVGSKFMIAAVRRVRQPGCQFDYLMVLEGPQGQGKSSTLKTLFGNAWFTDNLPHDIASKDASAAMSGVWGIELSEIDHVIRNETDTVKAFLSCTTDRYRPAYGKTTREFPRQCIMAGTTNKDKYLRDDTGNRRFWPVFCANKRFDRALLADLRDQLWSEAAVREAAGEAVYLTEGLEQVAGAVQDGKLITDVWEGLIASWLATQPDRVTTVADVLHGAVQVPRERMGRAQEMRAAAILKQCGWERFSGRDGAGVVRGWRRADSQATWQYLSAAPLTLPVAAGETSNVVNFHKPP